MASAPLAQPVRRKVGGTGLRRFSWLIFSLTVLLIFFGGQVKSTNSGLSVPDWPNTYGHFMFSFPLDRMIGGIFWEHSHRMIASVVGLLTFIQTIWIWRVDKRRWMKNLSVAASIAVLIQGILGGMTVLLYLPVWTSSTHGTLAQSYLCMVLILALGLSSGWNDRPKQVSDGGRPRLRTLAYWTVGAIFIQLILGAVMRHSEAGLAIPDFPTMFGSWWPPLSEESLARANTELAANGILAKMQLTEVTQGQILAHLAHRLWALVVTVLAVWTGVRVFRRYGEIAQLRRPALLMLALLTAQVTLGILIIYTEKQPSVATFHVTIGALTLVAAMTLAVRVRNLFYASGRSAEDYRRFMGSTTVTHQPGEAAA